MKPRISIIIPCYNQGVFLKEALESISHCEKEVIEVILVNDGSTDGFTNNYIDSLKNTFCVIIQENKGLSEARNTGIAASNGDFILPLDSDNRIKPAYITESIKILDNNSDIGVVYGNAEFFGEKRGIWKVGPFNLQRLMLGNYIDACAVIRKSVLDKVGLYDTQMKFGWEDWEMWLRIAFAGGEFYYLDEVVFDYRVNKQSMSKKLYSNYAKPNSIENYINNKYPSKLGPEWIVNRHVQRFKKNPLFFITKLVIRAYFPGYYKKLLSKNKIRNNL
ncbi:MAG: glycosyltransferase [Chitinophagaceae bacterium]|nr:glycosyltransferase [Chitinophagaceae bacterium]